MLTMTLSPGWLLWCQLWSDTSNRKGFEITLQEFYPGLYVGPKMWNMIQNIVAAMRRGSFDMLSGIDPLSGREAFMVTMEKWCPCLRISPMLRRHHNGTA